MTFSGVDHDLPGLAHVVPGQMSDALAQGGGEQVGLPLFRRGKVAEQALQIVDEAHVEHAVGLVDHEKADLLEEHLALL